MIFQWPSIDEMMPLIIAAIIIVADIFVLKIGLAITKAEDKTNFKWVAGSFGIQFGMIFFISLPMLLMGFMGAYSDGGPDPAIIALTLIFSAFIDLHIVNVLHKLGLKRSLIIVILIMGPLSWAMYLINSNLGYFLFAG
ncbi:MAG: hypothetical protein JSV23_08525 [Promethearchaeota archaeon]|nr:MAG: hypothetical protein JSV23_08525 [Candidatus Lokiarchaeota archaeon]